MENEGFYDAWERFNELQRECPHHRIPKEELIQTFYMGLNSKERRSVDQTAGGALMRRSIEDAEIILEDMARNLRDWGDENTTAQEEIITLPTHKHNNLFELENVTSFPKIGSQESFMSKNDLGVTDLDELHFNKHMETKTQMNPCFNMLYLDEEIEEFKLENSRMGLLLEAALQVRKAEDKGKNLEHIDEAPFAVECQRASSYEETNPRKSFDTHEPNTPDSPLTFEINNEAFKFIGTMEELGVAKPIANNYTEPPSHSKFMKNLMAIEGEDRETLIMSKECSAPTLNLEPTRQSEGLANLEDEESPLPLEQSCQPSFKKLENPVEEQLELESIEPSKAQTYDDFVDEFLCTIPSLLSNESWLEFMEQGSSRSKEGYSTKGVPPTLGAPCGRHNNGMQGAQVLNYGIKMDGRAFQWDLKVD